MTTNFVNVFRHFGPNAEKVLLGKLGFDFSQVCERSSQWCELRYSQVQTAH